MSQSKSCRPSCSVGLFATAVPEFCCAWGPSGWTIRNTLQNRRESPTRLHVSIPPPVLLRRIYKGYAGLPQWPLCALHVEPIPPWRMGYPDGFNPWVENLVFDAAGNIYGTTGNGGEYVQGTVFELPRRAADTPRVFFIISATGMTASSGGG